MKPCKYVVTLMGAAIVVSGMMAANPAKAADVQDESGKRVLVMATNNSMIPGLTRHQQEELGDVFQNWLTQTLQKKGMVTPEINSAVLKELQKLQEHGETGVLEYVKKGKIGAVDYILFTKVSDVRNVEKSLGFEKGVRCQIEAKLVNTRTAESRAVTGAADHYGPLISADSVIDRPNRRPRPSGSVDPISYSKATTAAWKAIQDTIEKLFLVEASVVMIEKQGATNIIVIQKGTECGFVPGTAVYIFKPMTEDVSTGTMIKRPSRFITEGKVVASGPGTAELSFRGSPDSIQKGYVVRTRKD